MAEEIFLHWMIEICQSTKRNLDVTLLGVKRFHFRASPKKMRFECQVIGLRVLISYSFCTRSSLIGNALIALKPQG